MFEPERVSGCWSLPIPLFCEVLEVLEGDNKHARLEAVFFINQCRTHRKNTAVPGLIRLLDEDDGDLQRGVIEALASFGPKAQAAVPRLT